MMANKRRRQEFPGIRRNFMKSELYFKFFVCAEHGFAVVPHPIMGEVDGNSLNIMPSGTGQAR
jgi:hypothetical protein